MGRLHAGVRAHAFEDEHAARAVVAQFRRDGFVAPESARRTEFQVWDRVTPGRVLLVGLQILLKLCEEDGRTDLGRPVRGLDEEEDSRRA